MGGRRQVLAVVLVVMAVLSSGAGHSCPELPMPTWELTQDSELIVLGRIVWT